MRYSARQQISALLMASCLWAARQAAAQQFGAPPVSAVSNRVVREWYGGPYFTACIETTFGPSSCSAVWRLGAGARAPQLVVGSDVRSTSGPGFLPANRGSGQRTAVMGEHLTLRPTNRESGSSGPAYGQGRGRGFGPPR